MKTDTRCSICSGPLDVKRTPDGKVYWTQGENAEPVNSGRCCESCNFAVVLPARLSAMTDGARQ